MTYSPDGRWILSDTYPDESDHRLLILFDTQRGERIDIGRFYTDPALGKINRCDLHPRWSRDGRQVCIDSVHEHQRQLYIVDVSAIVG
jgi:Tol biopolymer transport system component